MRHLVVTGDEFQEREDVVESPSLGESMLGIFQKQQEPLKEREREVRVREEGVGQLWPLG